MLPRLIDTVLEATVVPSFTRIGPAVRSRLDQWAPITTDLSGKQMLVTGGSSGLGRETASRLVDLGATVHLTSRSAERAEKVAAEINDRASKDRASKDRASKDGASKDGASKGRAIGAALDTSDFDSIRELAADLIATTDQLDVLIHNAGALTDEYRTNSNDLELTVASHLVGPYALTRLLQSHLSARAKVLWMSSGGMYTQGLDVDRIEMGSRNYRGAIAYARAKRGQVELVTHLGPIWAPDVIMHAMHPGWVDTDGVAQALPGFGKALGPLLRDPAAGADTMVWLASGGADEYPPGLFWLDRQPRSTSYLPGTGTDDATREQLIDWLDLATLPASIG